MVTVLADWLQPWSQLFRSSAAIQAVVLFGHLGAVALAGAFAVGTDRRILRVRGTSATARVRVLRDWSRVHRYVLAGLGVGILTGVAMLLSDVARFLPYWVFWLKMLLLTALLVNGRRLEREAGALRAILEAADGEPELGDRWSELREASVRSAWLWAATLLAGVLVTTA